MSSHARPYGFSPHPVTRPASPGRAADPGGDPARPVRPGREAATGDRARRAVRRQQADRARGPRIAGERRADPQGPRRRGRQLREHGHPGLPELRSLSESMDTDHAARGTARRRAHPGPAGARGSGGPDGGREPDRPAARAALVDRANASGRRRSTTRTSPPTTSRSTPRSDTPRATGCWPRSSARCTTPPILLSTSRSRPRWPRRLCGSTWTSSGRSRQAGRTRPSRPWMTIWPTCCSTPSTSQEGRRHDGSARAAARGQGRRHLVVVRGTHHVDVPRRHGRGGHQDRAGARRRRARMGTALPQRRGRLVPLGEPEQEEPLSRHPRRPPVGTCSSTC